MSAATPDRSAAALAALRQRIAEALEENQGGQRPHSHQHLADAALDRLRRVIESSGDRASALDLLAADALLTDACDVAAEAGSEELISFAWDLLDRIAELVPVDEAGSGEDSTMVAEP